MNRIILLTAFDGDGEQGRYRSEIEHILIPNMRKYMDYPIILCTDNAKAYKSDKWECREVEGICLGHDRYGYRSADYWRIKMPLTMRDTTVLYIDTDILIIDKAFVKGFALAEKFGFCLPEGPRVYSYLENLKGVDSISRNHLHKEKGSDYSHAVTYINGVMFMNNAVGIARKYMQAFVSLMETTPQRGPSVLSAVTLKTGMYPYLLPSQWCVTLYNRMWISEYKHAGALAIHASDPGVKSSFKDIIKEQ